MSSHILLLRSTARANWPMCCSAKSWQEGFKVGYMRTAEIISDGRV